jgi:TorA maturation chaperone TorD
VKPTDKGHQNDAHHGRAAGSAEGEPAARLAAVCARRAAVYRALVLGFAEPSPALVTSLGDLASTLTDVVAWLGPDAAMYDPAIELLASAVTVSTGSSLEERVAELSSEHARLFTGPGRPAVMCYASQYLDADERSPGRLNAAAAAYAAAAYPEQGVATVPNRGELPDHVTLELEFLFHLCRCEERAWAAGDDEGALATRRSLDRFLREHAARWLFDFVAAVRRETSLELYRGFAALLSAHLSAELGEAIAEVAAPSA